MNKNKLSLIATALAALLVSSPAASFAQSAATFSGEAVALKANAVGVSLALADTGALPSSGGSLSTSVASVDRKSTRLNSSHGYISYAVFCLKKKKKTSEHRTDLTTKSQISDDV